MTTQLRKSFRYRLMSLGSALAMNLLAFSFAQAANSWDAANNTHWWFDPANWSKDVLPPNNDAANAVTDTQINVGTGAWDQGFGVLYDPAHDPGFTAAQTATFPTGYGPQKIAQLYISRSDNPPDTIAVPAN